MASWKDLETFDGQAISTGLFCRTDATTLKLNQFKQELSQNKLTLADFILSNFMDVRDRILLKNKFPYHLEKCIEHLIFWMKPEAHLSQSRAKAMLLMEFGDVIVFETPHNKTTLAHYHVFVRLASFTRLYGTSYKSPVFIQFNKNSKAAITKHILSLSK